MQESVKNVEEVQTMAHHDPSERLAQPRQRGKLTSTFQKSDGILSQWRKATSGGLCCIATLFDRFSPRGGDGYKD
jgi:hypothetical protein